MWDKLAKLSMINVTKVLHFFFAAYYNSHRYIEKARGAFGLRKVTDYT